MTDWEEFIALINYYKNLKSSDSTFVGKPSASSSSVIITVLKHVINPFCELTYSCIYGWRLLNTTDRRYTITLYRLQNFMQYFMLRMPRRPNSSYEDLIYNMTYFMARNILMLYYNLWFLSSHDISKILF